MSEWSLNDLHEALGYETDRSGERVMLRRGRESRVRGSYDNAVYELCAAGEIAWFPAAIGWAQMRSLPVGGAS